MDKRFSAALAAALLVWQTYPLGCAAESLGNLVFPDNQALGVLFQVRTRTGKNLDVPRNILQCGIDFSSDDLSENSKQVADIIELSPSLDKLRSLKDRVNLNDKSVDGLSARLDYYEALLQAEEILADADRSVDYVLAEIAAERGLNSEILATYRTSAGRKAQWAGWASAFTNGALWSVCEAYEIPTSKRPRYAIPSGILGIIAGVVPSAFSLYAIRAAGGSSHEEQKQPNMLAQVLELSPDKETKFPNPVWKFLNSVPPGDQEGKTRKQQILERWQADKNIPGYTENLDGEKVEQLAGTAPVSRVNIAVLETRDVMLTQLSGEVWKMKKMLYELSTAVRKLRV